MNAQAAMVPLCFLLLHAIHATRDAEVASCPNQIEFKSFYAQVPDLGRRLRFASPCIGTHACGYALESMGVTYDTVNAFDLQEGYREMLTKHLQRAGQRVIDLNLGPVAGDLLRRALPDLELPVDFLVAGPPCPPWAGQGKRRGFHVGQLTSSIGNGLPPTLSCSFPNAYIYIYICLICQIHVARSNSYNQAPRRGIHLSLLMHSAQSFLF